MKHSICMAVSAALTLVMTGCVTSEQTVEKGGGTVGMVQLANPFVECSTLHDATLVAGFPMSVPNRLPLGLDKGIFRVIRNNLIEIVYRGDAGEEIRIRKGKGRDDISGHYGPFDKTWKAKVRNQEVTFKGKSGRVLAAVWTNGTHTFSITSEKGLDQRELEKMIEDIR